MRDRMTPGEQQRLLALLAEVRGLDVRVDVRSRVLRTIAGMNPEATSLLPSRLLGGSLAVALGACAAASAGLVAVLRARPEGVSSDLAAGALSLLHAARPLGAAVARIFIALGRATLEIVEIVTRPLPGGQAIVVSTTSFSLILMTAMIVTTFALLRRDLRRAAEPVERRNS